MRRPQTKARRQGRCGRSLNLPGASPRQTTYELADTRWQNDQRAFIRWQAFITPCVISSDSKVILLSHDKIRDFASGSLSNIGTEVIFPALSSEMNTITLHVATRRPIPFERDRRRLECGSTCCCLTQHWNAGGRCQKDEAEADCRRRNKAPGKR